MTLTGTALPVAEYPRSHQILLCRNVSHSSLECLEHGPVLPFIGHPLSQCHICSKTEEHVLIAWEPGTSYDGK